MNKSQKYSEVIEMEARTREGSSSIALRVNKNIHTSFLMYFSI